MTTHYCRKWYTQRNDVKTMNACGINTLWRIFDDSKNPKDKFKEIFIS